MPMREAKVTWLRDMTFDAQADGHHVILDARGQTGDQRGPTPVGLLLAALAGCTAMDVISILKKKRQDVSGLVVRVEGRQVDDHPHKFEDITITYEVHGKGVDRVAAERSVELSDEKYCSISATIRQGARIATRVEVVEDAS